METPIFRSLHFFSLLRLLPFFIATNEGTSAKEEEKEEAGAITHPFFSPMTQQRREIKMAPASVEFWWMEPPFFGASLLANYGG